MLIGITGTNASGKGTVAQYFQRNGYGYFSLSDELRTLMKAENIQLTRGNFIRYGTKLRAEKGNGCLAELVLKKAGRNAVVDSIRHPAEVEALKKRSDFILLAVDASLEMRFIRAKKRGRVGDGETLKDFRKNEEREMHGSGSSQQLAAVMAMADHTLRNDSTVAKLYKKLDMLPARHDTQR